MARSILDKKESICSTENLKQEEEKHIYEVLKRKNYPKWAIDRAKEQQQKPNKETRNRKTQKEQKNKHMVIVPYVKGVTERAARVYKKYNISTAMKPHCTLRQILVHKKDKV